MPTRLTDTEALLWSMEDHPSLSSTMGSVMLLDGPPDPDRVRRTVAHTVGAVERLRERVVEPLIKVAPPEWAIDPRLDLDHHLRFLRLPPKAGDDELADLAAMIVNDPFDRTRPLWQWTIITGLSGGRAAVISKLHHSIADGAGALQMGANLFDFADDAPEKPAIDLDALLRPDDDPDHDDEPIDPDRGRADSLRAGADRLVGLLNDAAGMIADPGRIGGIGNDAMATFRSLSQQFPGAGRHGSPLWAERSRNRRLCFLDGDLDGLRRSATAHGCRLNDVFVAGLAGAAVGYHHDVGAELPEIQATVVVSTRSEGDAAEHNAFVPVAITLPGDGAEPGDRCRSVRTQVDEAKERLAALGGDPLGSFSSIAGLVPSALTAAFTVDQASRVDFATSNLPGPPVPVWFAGRAVTRFRPIGPVSGTAFNATLLSYGERVSVGVHLDPAAIPDVALLRRCVADGFEGVEVTLR